GITPFVPEKWEIVFRCLLNSQQEHLKAQLKSKTEELNAKIYETKTKHANLKKRVKVATRQGFWIAFGIRARR
ncbi:MAG TPA: hypothetical protein PLD25_30185, partial [Chloroflexota bacterium]|nr:hypothetical protein [Chloroflexota bacterium]